MRDYAPLRPSINTSRRLAKCGKDAVILFALGLTQVDNFGRLLGSVEKLADNVVTALLRFGEFSEEDVEAARTALCAADLWHLCTVDKVEVVHYVHFDENQPDREWLERRGTRGCLPDPPDRPELWIANRPHNQGKRAKQTAPPADKPPEKAPEATPEPTPKVTFLDGFTELVKAHEAHTVKFATEPDKDTARAILADAAEAGVPWQALLTIMKDAQAEYLREKKTRASPTVGSMRYYVRFWEPHLRTTVEARAAPSSQLQTEHRPRVFDTRQVE